MKRIRIFLLILMVAAVLCGCAVQTEFPMELEGYTLTVHTDTCTITHGQDVYTYERTSSHMWESTIVIRYPTGATYTKYTAFDIAISGGDGTVSEPNTDPSQEDDGQYKGDVDENRYVPGRILVKAVKSAVYQKEAQNRDRERRTGYVFIAIFLLAIGLVNALWPKMIWYLRHWWSVEGGEPTDAFLSITRIGGVVATVIGVLYLIAGIF